MKFRDLSDEVPVGTKIIINFPVTTPNLKYHSIEFVQEQEGRSLFDTVIYMLKGKMPSAGEFGISIIDFAKLLFEHEQQNLTEEEADTFEHIPTALSSNYAALRFAALVLTRLYIHNQA